MQLTTPIAHYTETRSVWSRQNSTQSNRWNCAHAKMEICQLESIECFRKCPECPHCGFWQPEYAWKGNSQNTFNNKIHSFKLGIVITYFFEKRLNDRGQCHHLLRLFITNQIALERSMKQSKHEIHSFQHLQVDRSMRILALVFCVFDIIAGSTFRWHIQRLYQKTTIIIIYFHLHAQREGLTNIIYQNHNEIWLRLVHDLNGLLCSHAIAAVVTGEGTVDVIRKIFN